MPEEFTQSKYKVLLVENNNKDKAVWEFESELDEAGENGLRIINANLSATHNPRTGDTTYHCFAVIETRKVTTMVPTQSDLEVF